METDIEEKPLVEEVAVAPDETNITTYGAISKCRDLELPNHVIIDKLQKKVSPLRR